MSRRKKVAKYIKEYEWSNVFRMIKNNRLDPKTCNDDFKGKLVLITGATSGIGYLTARKYASMGADLLCINRNKEKSDKLRAEIENEYGVNCKYMLADFSEFDDVRHVTKLLKDFQKPLDVLIFNAGQYLTKKELTAEGIEKVFMVHYLSPFYITYSLREKLKSQEQARIILVNSEGHRFAAWGLRLDDLNWEKRRYAGLKSYGSAKLAQLLSMLVFDDQFKDSNVTINAMHPGAVKTETGQENGLFYRLHKKYILDKVLKPADISAEALYYLGASTEVEKISGKFFNLTTEEEPSPPALDREVADELWEKSLELSKLQ